MIVAICSLALAREFEAEAMATRVSVQLPDDEHAEGDAAVVFEIFRSADEDANEWRPGSPIAAVNAAAGGGPVAVPASTWSLVERAVALGRLTDGAFDLTWAALWGLWDFHQPRLPDPAEIHRRLPLIDYARVELGAGTIRLPDPEMRIGLGGIAKGWALDQAQRELRRRGRTDFLLSAGGQAYAAGTNEQGRPWQVGVRDPDGDRPDSIAVLGVTDASVSTSGDYERFFLVDGVRYHHILDPKTGWPARGLRAVTVLSPDAVLADTASTAILVAGPQKAAALARTLGVQAMWIDDAGLVYETRGMPVLWRR